MSSYLSPATFQTPNEWKARGPLGGFLAGMNQDISNQLVSRGMAQDDVELQMNKAKLEDELASQQSKRSGYDLKDTENNYNKDQYLNGSKEQEAAMERAIKKAQLTSVEGKNEDDDRVRAANLWNDMSEELKGMGGQINMMDPNQRTWYEGWRKKMEKYAPGMPPAAGPEDAQRFMMQGDKAKQFLAMKQQAAMNSLAFKQKEAAAVSNDERDTARAKELAGIHATSAEKIAGLNNEAKMEVARVKAEKDKFAADTMKLFTNDVDRINAHDGVMVANGGDVEHNMAQAERWAKFSAEQELQTRFLEYGRYKASSKPEERAIAQAALDQKIAENLSTVKGYKEAQAKGFGNTLSAAAAAPKGGNTVTSPSSAIEAGLKKQGKTYEPDKYEYKIDKNGNILRKSK